MCVSVRVCARVCVSVHPDPGKYNYTPRLFRLSASSGVFEGEELLYAARVSESVMAMPFLQEKLYSAQQPGEPLASSRSPATCSSAAAVETNQVRLLQPCSCWTTTWRSTCGRAGSPTTRSAPARPRSAGTTSANAPWRQCCSTAKVETEVESAQLVSLESLVALTPHVKQVPLQPAGTLLSNYSCLCFMSTEKNPRRPPLAYLVQAGYEPLTFTNIFPYWVKDSSVTSKVG